LITSYHAKYFAHELTLRHASGGVDRLSQSLFDASVDLNPHQIDAALFALRNPLQQGVLLADEVGLGKTIEAALVLCQFWAERRRRLLVVCPASLRKQWAQELHDKFAVPSAILDVVAMRKHRAGDLLATLQTFAGKQVVIMSYQFAAKLEAELRAVPWDVVVIDEAHKLRNAHRTSNRTGQALRRALDGRKKLLLTATPLQNTLLELYGLSTFIDEHLFGDEAAFRKQYMANGGNLDELRGRLATFTKRTLRRDVLEYVTYTQRKALTQPFNPTDDEQSLYERISAFLQNEDSFALPKRQRHLTSLILRKLLASSSQAVSATLNTIRTRLQRMLDGEDVGDGRELVEQLVDDDELEEDILEEQAEDAEHDTGQDPAKPAITSIDASAAAETSKRKAIQLEIVEITAFIDAATALTTDTKAQSLLRGLELGFAHMAEMKAPRKAIVFTESRRTQEYLHRFLSANGYAGKLAMFSGTNNHEEQTAIYQAWLEQYKGTDRVTGSPQVDRRTALIDHFRKDDGSGADIMIATEAAAEGVNLQFCALVINYDLPWNPQRVEQRIGRCHRYGQRYDVVVINFLNTRNQADQRVLELLTQKFNLFSGVFGASDEVLGRIEGGIDFEKRILQIYDTCRRPEDTPFTTPCLDDVAQVIEPLDHRSCGDLLEPIVPVARDVRARKRRHLDARYRSFTHGKQARSFGSRASLLRCDLPQVAVDQIAKQVLLGLGPIDVDAAIHLGLNGTSPHFSLGSGVKAAGLFREASAANLGPPVLSPLLESCHCSPRCASDRECMSRRRSLSQNCPKFWIGQEKST
jgi:ERCC4-related helicase